MGSKLEKLTADPSQLTGGTHLAVIENIPQPN